MSFLHATSHDAIALADLEAFDPQAPAGGRERRFCCPLPPCAGKPIDSRHRTLSLNTETGLWTCYRCHRAGKLREHWTPRPDARRQRAARAFSLRPESAPPDPAKLAAVQKMVAGAAPIVGTPGADYLEKRSIPTSVAERAGVLYAADFFGRPAILFPLQDRTGTIVALSGRYIDGQEERGDLKTRTLGPKKLGIFAPPGALHAAPVVITEAAIDALSLTAVGVPAVALDGVSWPDWLPGACAFQQVAVALDADAGGDEAAAKLTPALQAFGAKVERWRPTIGKDWNELLCAIGPTELGAALAGVTDSMGDDEPESDWCGDQDQILRDVLADAESSPTEWQVIEGEAIKTYRLPWWVRLQRAGFDVGIPAREIDVPAEPGDPHVEALELEARWRRLGESVVSGPAGEKITDLRRWLNLNMPEKWEAVRWALGVHERTTPAV